MPTFIPAGTKIAGYRIESLIGRGGMAVVYRAEHLRLGRKVALKLIAPEYAENERFRQRFIRESQLAAAIDHPNVLPVYEADEVDGLLYIAMRYVDGTDLKDMLAEQGRLDTGQTLSIFQQVARALDVAHGRGLIHRDVKPGNILITAGPDVDEPFHVYLSDFGLTKRATSHSGLTDTGQFVGTIDYVAPEQITAKPVGPYSDIYGLGCVLFECLTGSIPFDRDSDAATLWAHVNDQPPAVTSLNPILPEAVDEVVATAMAKAPEDRFGSCRQLVAALQSALESGAPPAISGPQAIPAPAPMASALPSTAPILSTPTASAPAAARPPPSPGRPPAGRRLLVLLAVALLVVAGITGVVLRGRNRTTAFAATHEVPLSFTYPAEWQEHLHPGVFTVLSPHNMIAFFAPGDQWATVRPWLHDDKDSVVGAYLPFGPESLDVSSSQAVQTELQALLPEQVKIRDHQPVQVDGRAADRVSGRMVDPSNQATSLAFLDYVIQVKTGVAVHLLLFGPDERTLEARDFEHLVDSIRVDAARVAELR